jgi:hypothetical protein
VYKFIKTVTPAQAGVQRKHFRIPALFKALICLFLLSSSGGDAVAENARRIELPPARTDGPLSLGSTLQQRSSVRSFADVPVAVGLHSVVIGVFHDPQLQQGLSLGEDAPPCT